MKRLSEQVTRHAIQATSRTNPLPQLTQARKAAAATTAAAAVTSVATAAAARAVFPLKHADIGD